MKNIATVHFLTLLLMLAVVPSLFGTVDPTGASAPVGNYLTMGPVLKEGGSTARVTAVSKVTTITVKDPYTNTNRTVSAGTIRGTLDGNSADFYCIDFAHPLAFYTTSNPHEYTDSMFTPSEITYILNNYYPFRNAPGALADASEAAAVQVAIWKFADGMDASTVTNTAIRNRALAIIQDAQLHAGNTTPIPALSILPPLQTINTGTNAQFQVRVVDLQNNPMNNVQIALTATSGNLSSPAVSTNVSGLAGPVTLVPGAANTSTVTATATVTIPHGTRYIHKIQPNNYQKLVLATPVVAEQNTTGIVNWQTPTNGVCDLNGFATFTQGGWGSKPNSGPGRIRENNFNQVFPNGLRVGGNYTLTFTSSAAVQAFLPQGGTSGAFNQNYTNPTSTSAGVLAGQLVALKLNVEYSAAGVLGTNAQSLGSLTITSGPLKDKTVNELLALMNTAIGGGSVPYTYSQLSDAATAINENFNSGSGNNGFLTCGLKPVIPILECVVNNGNGTYTAHFGYENQNSFAVSIPVSSANTFNPGGDLGQPTVFNPGRTGYYPDSDFQVTFNGQNLVWHLNGRTVTANAQSPQCVENIYFSKKWLDENGSVLSGPPANLSSNYKIVATSALGTAQGVYVGGSLSWTYQNNAGYGNDGLAVPVNGNYTVQEFHLPAGYAPLNGIGTFVSQIPGGYATNPYNGFDKYGHHVVENKKMPGAKLGDKVWLDLDMDGVQDHNEEGVTGILVKLFDCNNNFVASTTTGEYGLYLFENLTPGSYAVEFSLPNNYAFSPKNQGGDPALDSDADPVTGKTVCTDLTAGETDLTWDAGIYLATASLGDYVWLDENKNGIQESSEQGIPNVTVKLFNCNNQLIATSQTNSYGFYLFETLAPGSYYVEFIRPTNYIFSPKNQGTDPALDSDADQATGKTACTQLTSGENDLSWDAGMYIDIKADLSIEKSVNKADAKHADILTYTVIVRNDGPNEATGVTVRDLLPVGMMFKTSTATQGSYDYLNGLWTVGTIPSGGSASLSINAEVNVNDLNTSSIDLGPAKDFNGFILYDFTAPSSDTEGRLAVGRNFTAGNYSVGDKLDPSYGTVDVLVVGQNLIFTSGRVYNGNTVYGNSTNLPVNPVGITGGSLRKDSVVDFAAAESYLNNLSNTLGNYTVNGTTTIQWGGIILDGSNPMLNVFEVSAAQLSSANNFEINVPNGAVVLVNIKGATMSWSGGHVVNGTSISNVLYNFPEATALTISNIDIRGTILAPKADVNFVSGVQNGQMIARSFRGEGQLNYSLFIGNLPVDETVTNIAEVITSDQDDPDSSPGNGVNTEDDYDIAATRVTTAGSTSTGGGGGFGTGVWQYVGQFALNEMVWTLANDALGNIIAGTMGGKIYRVTGQTITRINETMNVGYIWKIVVDAAGAIYAGTEDGVYKTTNNGSTWFVAGLAGKDTRAMVIEADGTILAGTWGAGVYKSVDAGATWLPVGQNFGNAAVHALVRDANGDLFCGTFDDGIYRSVDHAATWSKTAISFRHIWSLGVTSTGILFAGTYGNGVYRSNDNGATWVRMSSGLSNGYIYAVTVDAGDNVYVSTWAGGVFASADMGVTWHPLGMGGFGVSSMVLNPQSNYLYVGTSNGALYMINSIATGVEGESQVLPTEFMLMQNYPNPFNPATSISYALPKSEKVTLKVYDILGSEVATLVNEMQPAGNHVINFDARRLSSGVYFYRIQAGNFTQVKKMVLIR